MCDQDLVDIFWCHTNRGKVCWKQPGMGPKQIARAAVNEDQLFARVDQVGIDAVADRSPWQKFVGKERVNFLRAEISPNLMRKIQIAVTKNRNLLVAQLSTVHL